MSAHGRSRKSTKTPPFGVLQRIVDIPGFRVFVGGAGDVMHADVFMNWRNFFAPAVIEDPDIELCPSASRSCEA